MNNEEAAQRYGLTPDPGTRGVPTVGKDATKPVGTPLYSANQHMLAADTSRDIAGLGPDEVAIHIYQNPSNTMESLFEITGYHGTGAITYQFGDGTSLSCNVADGRQSHLYPAGGTYDVTVKLDGHTFIVQAFASQHDEHNWTHSATGTDPITPHMIGTLTTQEIMDIESDLMAWVLRLPAPLWYIPEPPFTPDDGDLWVDSDEWVYTENPPIVVSPTEPANHSLLWWDSNTNALKAWDPVAGLWQGAAVGVSAYETWKIVAGQPQGTQAEFIAALQGAQGIPGDKGDKGDAGETVKVAGIVPDQGHLPPTPPLLTWYMLQNPAGELWVYDPSSPAASPPPAIPGFEPPEGWVPMGRIAGPQGIQGIQGDKGDQGDSPFFWPTVPDDANIPRPPLFPVANNDLVIVHATGHLWQYHEDQQDWVDVGEIGRQGPAGPGINFGGRAPVEGDTIEFDARANQWHPTGWPGIRDWSQRAWSAGQLVDYKGVIYRATRAVAATDPAPVMPTVEHAVTVGNLNPGWLTGDPLDGLPDGQNVADGDVVNPTGSGIVGMFGQPLGQFFYSPADWFLYTTDPGFAGTGRTVHGEQFDRGWIWLDHDPRPGPLMVTLPDHQGGTPWERVPLGDSLRLFPTMAAMHSTPNTDLTTGTVAFVTETKSLYYFWRDTADPIFVDGAWLQVMDLWPAAGTLQTLHYDPQLPHGGRIKWTDDRPRFGSVANIGDLNDRTILPLTHLILGKLVFVRGNGKIYELVADPDAGPISNTQTDWQELGTAQSPPGLVGIVVAAGSPADPGTMTWAQIDAAMVESWQVGSYAVVTDPLTPVPAGVPGIAGQAVKPGDWIVAIDADGDGHPDTLHLVSLPAPSVTAPMVHIVNTNHNPNATPAVPGKRDDIYYSSLTNRMWIHTDTMWWELTPGGTPQGGADGAVLTKINGVTQWALPGDGSPVGTIAMWPSITPPGGWLLCDGSAIPTAYADLIALVGSRVPDLRGQFVRGAGQANQINMRVGWSTGAPHTAFRALNNGQHSHGGAVGQSTASTATTSEDGDHTHSTWTVSGSGRGWLTGGTPSGVDGGGGAWNQFNVGHPTAPATGPNHHHTVTLPAHNHTIPDQGPHNHAVAGGDPETAPDHVFMAFIIKADKTNNTGPGTTDGIPGHGVPQAGQVLTVDATGHLAWTTPVVAQQATELKPPVADASALPATGNTDGDIRITLDDGHIHIWHAANSTWVSIGPAAAPGAPLGNAAPKAAGTAAAGAATSSSREDHVHPHELPTGAVAFDLLTSTGTAPTWTNPGSFLGLHLIHDQAYKDAWVANRAYAQHDVVMMQSRLWIARAATQVGEAPGTDPKWRPLNLDDLWRMANHWNVPKPTTADAGRHLIADANEDAAWVDVVIPKPDVTITTTASDEPEHRAIWTLPALTVVPAPAADGDMTILSATQFTVFLADLSNVPSVGTGTVIHGRAITPRPVAASFTLTANPTINGNLVTFTGTWDIDPTTITRGIAFSAPLAPATGNEGDVFYNSHDKRLWIHDAVTWGEVLLNVPGVGAASEYAVLTAIQPNGIPTPPQEAQWVMPTLFGFVYESQRDHTASIYKARTDANAVGGNTDPSRSDFLTTKGGANNGVPVGMYLWFAEKVSLRPGTDLPAGTTWNVAGTNVATGTDFEVPQGTLVRRVSATSFIEVFREQNTDDNFVEDHINGSALIGYQWPFSTANKWLRMWIDCDNGQIAIGCPPDVQIAYQGADLEAWGTQTDPNASGGNLSWNHTVTNQQTLVLAPQINGARCSARIEMQAMPDGTWAGTVMGISGPVVIMGSIKSSIEPRISTFITQATGNTVRRAWWR